MKYGIKMKKPIFKLSKTNKGNYTFNYRISTDGHGCSISFVRNELRANGIKKKVKNVKKPKGYVDEKYVDDLTQYEKRKIVMNKSKYIGIDPGKNKLICCTECRVDQQDMIEEKKNGAKTYRHTNNMNYSSELRKDILGTEKIRQRIKEYKDVTKRKKELNVQKLENELCRV